MPKADRATITDIAALAQVSVCTVNNALNGKGRMSEATREKVLRAAQKAGYTPNRMAQALARRPIRLVIVRPDAWPEFYGPLVNGALAAAADLADRKVSAGVVTVPEGSDAKALVKVLSKAIKPAGAENIGVLLCPGDDRWAAMGAQLEAAGIPLVLLGLDLPGVTRSALIRHDAVLSGRIAAELLAPMVGERPVAVLIGDHGTADHRDKLAGFQAEANRLGLQVAGVYETHDRPAQAGPAAAQALAAHANLGGIYVASDNSVGVCDLLRERNLAGRIKLALTGIFPAARRNLEAGVAQFALYQRMHEQGRLAAQTLYRQLGEGVIPPAETRIAPLIATRSNVGALASGEEAISS